MFTNCNILTQSWPAASEAVVSHDVSALPKQQCLLFRFNIRPFSERTERRGAG